MAKLAGLILVSALTVIMTDLLFGSSLLHALRPQIIEPADGAIVTAPVVVSWQGPRPMHAFLVGSGLRVDLGVRDSPFAIDAEHFPKPGRYTVQVHSPPTGGLIRTERAFQIQIAAAPPSPAPAAPPTAKRETTSNADAMLTRLRAERDQIESERLALAEQKANLERENHELAQELDELRNSEDLDDQQRGEAENERSALMQEHQSALQENQILRQQLDNIPACTTWGYLSLARNQAVPRRVVQVSNGRGQVFRNEAQCIAVRRSDPAAISACACVGAVWDAMP